MSLAVSGCEWLETWPESGSTPAKREAALMLAQEATPETRVVQTADGTWLAPDQRAKVVPTQAELLSATDTLQKITALEKEVQALRNDMSLMMPALTKLVNAQTSLQSAPTLLQDTLNQVQPQAGSQEAAVPANIHRQNAAWQDQAGAEFESDAMTMQAPAAAVPVPQQPPAALVVPKQQAPVAAPAQIAPQMQPQPVSMPSGAAQGTIREIRFGVHPDKVRLVLDSTAPNAFTYNVDNQQKVLVVDLPGATWDAGAYTLSVANNPLFAGYTATGDGQGGTRLTFQLIRPAQVLMAQGVLPTGDQGNRVVIDLAASY